MNSAKPSMVACVVPAHNGGRMCPADANLEHDVPLTLC